MVARHGTAWTLLVLGAVFLVVAVLAHSWLLVLIAAALVCASLVVSR